MISYVLKAVQLSLLAIQLDLTRKCLMCFNSSSSSAANKTGRSFFGRHAMLSPHSTDRPVSIS